MPSSDDEFPVIPPSEMTFAAFAYENLPSVTWEPGILLWASPEETFFTHVAYGQHFVNVTTHVHKGSLDKIKFKFGRLKYTNCLVTPKRSYFELLMNCLKAVLRSRRRLKTSLTWAPELDILKIFSFVEITVKQVLHDILQLTFSSFLAMKSLSCDEFVASSTFLSRSLIGRLAATQYENPTGSFTSGFWGKNEVIWARERKKNLKIWLSSCKSRSCFTLPRTACISVRISFINNSSLHRSKTYSGKGVNFPITFRSRLLPRSTCCAGGSNLMSGRTRTSAMHITWDMILFSRISKRWEPTAFIVNVQRPSWLQSSLSPRKSAVVPKVVCRG